MEKMIDLNYLNRLYNILNNYTSTAYPVQILEPVTTIVILVILAFKPQGTKIAVQNNKIHIQEYNFLQPLSRWYHGNNREEIQYLCKPIIRSLEILTPFTSENLKLKQLFLYAIDGIQKLKLSYNNISSTTCHTLDLYINLIKKNLESGDTMDINYNNNNIELSVNSVNNFKNLFKNIWNEDELNLIIDIVEIGKQSNINFLCSIENIIHEKEKIIEKLIKDTSNLI